MGKVEVVSGGSSVDMSGERCPYKYLGVERDCSAAEAQKAYRRLADLARRGGAAEAGRAVMRRIDPNSLINAAEYEQRYRRSTENMTYYPVPRMQWCPSCRKNRTWKQFTEGKKFCNDCRRKK